MAAEQAAQEIAKDDAARHARRGRSCVLQEAAAAAEALGLPHGPGCGG